MKRCIAISGISALVVAVLAAAWVAVAKPHHDAAWNQGYAYAESHRSDYGVWADGGLGPVAWCTAKSFLLDKPGLYIDDWRGGGYTALGR